MSLYALKPRFQSLLRPLVSRLHRAGVTANQVTVATCLVSVALGMGLAANAERLQWFLLLPVWFLLRMALNAVDGMLAREYAQQSTLGAYLNELTDVVSDAALYLPFAFVAGVLPVAVGFLVFLAALSEFAGVIGASLGASRRYDGPMGKSDRAFVFGALGLLLGLGVAPDVWLNIALWAVCGLTAVTTMQRVRRGIAEITRRSPA
jgi:CDP-diacylglycerol---glycerol-3-phosphate 3-phosphatidyltransferase